MQMNHRAARRASVLIRVDRSHLAHTQHVQSALVHAVTCREKEGGKKEKSGSVMCNTGQHREENVTSNVCEREREREESAVRVCLMHVRVIQVSITQVNTMQMGLPGNCNACLCSRGECNISQCNARAGNTANILGLIISYRTGPSRANINVCTRAHTHMNTDKHTHMDRKKDTQIHKYSHTYPLPHTRACGHTHTEANTEAHLTQTHKHIKSIRFPSFPLFPFLHLSLKTLLTAQVNVTQRLTVEGRLPDHPPTPLHPTYFSPAQRNMTGHVTARSTRMCNLLHPVAIAENLVPLGNVSMR